MTESIEQKAGGDKQRHGGRNVDQTCEDENVPDVVIPDIDKFVRYPVISSVDRPGRRLLQAVNIEHGL